MPRLSSWLFITFNILALVSGCLAMGSYIYFQIYGVTDCKNVVQKPLIVMGIALIVIAIIGLIGTLWELSCLLWFYSFLTMLALLGLTVFSIIIYMVENPNGTSNLSILGFKKHNFGQHHTQWLSNMVEKGNQWSGIRDCLIDHQVCNRIIKGNLVHDASDFLVHHFTPIENGCCKPPMDCGYEYMNGTSWEIPKSGPLVKDRDCKTWSNNKQKLCYDCDSCKAGVLEESSSTWMAFAILDLIDIAILLVMYTLSCCTRSHILSRKKYNRVRAIP